MQQNANESSNNEIKNTSLPTDQNLSDQGALQPNQQEFLFSVKTKNYEPNKNVKFETKKIKENELEKVFRNHNYSSIIWSGRRDGDNFQSACGLILDIDEILTIEDAIKRIDKLNLNYALITSKSHTKENHKFHIFIPFTIELLDGSEFIYAFGKFREKHFSESDSKVVDAARYLFGSSEESKYISDFTRNNLDINKYLKGYDARKHKTEFTKIKYTWNKDLIVKKSDGTEERADTILEKTAIYCPFHDDNNPSAFVKLNENGNNHFIHCSTCDFTFWKEELSLEERTIDYWSYKKEVLQMGFTDGSFFFHDIGEKKFYARINTFEKEEKAKAFSYLANTKHIDNISTIEYIGDINAEKPYYTVRSSEGKIIAHTPAIAEQVPDNDFIEKYLEDMFGEHKEFIKQYMAVYTYTNYRKLPSLIFFGERGTGKTVAYEFISEIYKPLYDFWKGKEEAFQYEAEKKLLVIEENKFGEAQYETLKKYSGTRELTVNKKFVHPYKVKNNCNIIIISNEPTPLKVNPSELPKDEFNNQFFVYRFKPITGSVDADLLDKLKVRLGHYIRTELKKVFDSLVMKNYRYSIRVPITPEEQELFVVNKTSLDTDADLFIQRIEEEANKPYITSYKDFLIAGWVPVDMLKDASKKDEIRLNLQDRGYLKREKPSRPQISGKRKYCYEMTTQLRQEIILPTEKNKDMFGDI